MNSASCQRLSSPATIGETRLRQQQIRSVFQQIILLCVRHRIDHWWNCHNIDSLPGMRHVLRELILRRAGDYCGFIRLSDELNLLTGETSIDDYSLLQMAKHHIDPDEPHAMMPSDIAEVQAETGEAESAAGAPPYISAIALQDGLLALHAAEFHPKAEGYVADLRLEAQRIWESDAASVTPHSDPEHIHNIVRMLCHFDLLSAARECQVRHDPCHDLIPAFDEFIRHKGNTIDWATAPCAAGDDGVRYMIGMTIWGRRYIDFFCNFHLASLLADGNLPALARRGKVIVSIVTDTEGQTLIEGTPILPQLRMLADIRFSITSLVPRRDTEETARTFYRRYGLLEHLHVEFARRIGAHLMMMPVDTVISRLGLSVLAEAIAEGADCVTASCIEADRDSAMAELAPLRADGRIAIAAAHLTSIAVRHKTAYFKSLIVAAGNRLNAHPREFFWRVPGGYVCHALFVHPVMLSARALARDFHPNHENVDWALLPRLLTRESRITIIEDNSRLFILHCSDSGVRAGEYSDIVDGIDGRAGEYLIGVHLHDFPLHRRLLKQRQFFSVDDPAQPISPRYLAESSALSAMFDMVTPPSK